MQPLPLNVGTWQEIVAWVALGMILFTLVGGKALLKYRMSSAEERRQIRSLKPDLARARGHTVTTRSVDDGGFRDRVRTALLDGEPPDEVTVRDALAEIRAAIARATPALPLVAIRGLLEAAGFVLIGVLVFSSLDVWERFLDPSLDPAGQASAAATWLQTVAADLALAFPFITTLYELALAAGLLAANSIWGAWLGLAVYLAVGAVAVTLLKGRIDGAATVLDRRPLTARGLALRGVAIYIAGAGTAAAIGIIAPAKIAEAVGLGIAVITVVALSTTAWKVGSVGRQFASGWIDRRRHGTPEDVAGPDFPPARSKVPDLHLKAWGLVLGRDVYAASSVLLAPLLLAYVGYFFVSGRVVELGGVFASAPVTSQLGVALLAIAGLMGVLRALGEAGDSFRTAVGRALRSYTVRTWMFTRGIPVVGAVLAGMTAAAFVARDAGSAIVLVVGVTVAVGAGLRVVGGLWMRIKYRFVERAANRSSELREVIVEPYIITDADGGPIYVADVAGTRLANRDVEQLLDDVVATAENLLEEGGVSRSNGWVTTGLDSLLGDGVLATESRYFAKQLEQGIADRGRVQKRLRGDVRTRARFVLSDVGGTADQDAFREQLARDYPGPTVEQQLVELQRRGEVELQQGKYVLKSDPRAFGS